MSGLKTLALCFVVAASAFLSAAELAAHPEIVAAGTALAANFDAAVWQPAVAYAWRTDAMLLNAPTPDARVMIALDPPTRNPPKLTDARTNAHFDLPPIVRPRVVDGPTAGPQFAAAAPQIILPDLPAAPLPPRGEAPPLAARLSPEQHRAAARLAASLTPEMRANFDLFLYVSKAAQGPLAQRMYVFRKTGGDLALAHDWAASTGREKIEISPRGAHTMTGTPRGYYELDPGRMYARYRSYSWNQEMPYAMFFNWQRAGLQTGLAIHAASGDDIARLGSRASAGCVHLAPDNARMLFNLIRDDYRGQVPRLAYDARSDSSSNDGHFAHDAAGRLKLGAGYKVLIFIEDYSGSGDTVAALF